MAPGTTRIRTAAELLERHDVDIVGFQEFQRDQFTEFKKIAGETFAVYPGFQLGKPEVVNSIAWRKDTWDLVKADHIDIPYFDGQKRKMPVIRLRHKKTGQEAFFANFHNPANTRKRGDQERWRDLATQKQVELVNRLRRETGLPVFITGDMNEREEYYDSMTRGAGMVSADAGPKGQRPKSMGIDWIFGSPEVSFSDYKRDRSALVKKTSDHPMIVSTAKIKDT
jgi:endonuclease/exonuclease/phosphatase family metal-dependent hydrolase